MARFSLLAASAAFAALAAVAAAQDDTRQRCYFPDGSIDLEGYVCNGTAAATGAGSACCLHDDACYASGVCFQDWSGVFYRRSCTDPNYRAGACPKQCAQEAPDDWIWIQQCNVKERKACCLSTDTPCCDGELFDWRPGYIAAVINGDGTNRLTPYVDADGNIKSDSIFTTTAMQPAPSSSSSLSFSSSESSSNPTDAPTPAPTVAEAAASTASNANRHRNVAIAVGVVFGLVATGALGLLLLCAIRFRRRDRERRAEFARQMPAGAAGGQPGYGPGPGPGPVAEKAGTEVAVEMDASQAAAAQEFYAWKRESAGGVDVPPPPPPAK